MAGKAKRSRPAGTAAPAAQEAAAPSNRRAYAAPRSFGEPAEVETEFLPLHPQVQRVRLAQPRQELLRWGLGLVVVFAVMAGGLLALHPAIHEGSRPLAWLVLLLALLALGATQITPQWRGPAATAVFALASVALVLFAGALGQGIVAPGLGALGVLCALSAASGGLAAALAVTGLSLVCFAVLHLAPESLPFVTVAAGHNHTANGVALVMGAVVVLLGLACGLAVRRLLARYINAADDREQRISGLLALAVDAHWELDASLRLAAVSAPRDDAVTQLMRQAMGQLPWELPSFGCDPEVLDELRADLEARAPFRDLPVQWRSRSGLLRYFVVSGEPRFDERGRFRGYWGVAREVTAQVRARAALEATESRYQELFSRIPTPLVLHRAGHVVDANAAALRLFGYADLSSFLGQDLLIAHESGDSRERARRRMEQLEELPVGESLAVTEGRLLTHDGRRLNVRTAGVRIEVPGGPATLSIYVDDTERRRADEAVRRSEALLSHLVATSPDVITLTDVATGRYAMVNQTFESLSGYSSAEVVGKTSLELGIWADPTERDRFVQKVREKGSTREMPCRFVVKSGAVVQLLISGAVFAMDRRSYLVINGRDISAQERSRLERDAILENASIGIAVTREQRFVLTNPRFNEMYGWGEGELVGQSGSLVWTDEEAYRQLGAQIGPLLVKGELVEIERRAKRRDGSHFLARVQGKAIDPNHPAKGGTIWLVEDITERRQVAEALARARDEAEAANRAKSAFLANTSHELRTPLNGMLGLAQLARDPQLDAVRREQYLDQIVDNARALAAILSDVLDFSKIEAGKLVLEQTVFDLGELLNTLKQGYGALAAGRGLTLRLEMVGGDTGPEHGNGLGHERGNGLGHVRGDPLRVRQVLSNFLSNALKFSHAGEVLMRATRLGGDPSREPVRFEVIDNGPGLDEATQSRLFKPFTQADESTTRRFGGTGLGLSISRELAHLMGGEVGVRSAPGQGACFWAELQLPAVNTPARVARAGSDASLSGLKVLLVEDNAVNMLIGVALLQRWGARVEQAVDGREAVQAVQDAHQRGEPFNLVLMDVQMPVMSGHEATRALRAMEAGRTLPIIALTAAALVSEREAALASGMNDFLTKPIDAERLRLALARWAKSGVVAGQD